MEEKIKKHCFNVRCIKYRVEVMVERYKNKCDFCGKHLVKTNMSNNCIGIRDKKK